MYDNVRLKFGVYVAALASKAKEEAKRLGDELLDLKSGRTGAHTVAARLGVHDGLEAISESTSVLGGEE